MENKDIIKELFSEKLGGYEAPVKPELWTAVSSQIGASTAAASGSGLTVVAKSLIGVAAAGVLGVATYFAVSSDPETDQQPKVVVTEQPVIADETPSVADVKQEAGQTQEQSPEVVVQEGPETPMTGIHQDPQTATEQQQANEKPGQPVYQPKVREGNPIWVKDDTSGGAETETAASQTAHSPASNGQDSTQPREDKGVKNEGTDPGASTVQAKATITLLPDVFTPNNDGANDEFFIEHTGRLLDFQLVVIDAKNTVVYQTNDPEFIWRGVTRQGEEVQDGNYYYIITARDEAGNPVNAYNKLTITRTN